MKIEKIYIDMDGVLADFDRWKDERAKTDPRVLDDKTLWDAVKEVPHFYATLEPMPEAFILMDYLRGLNVPLAILTALPRRSSIPEAEQDKADWVKRHIGNIEFNVGPYAIDKQRLSRPGHVLIDDNEKNIAQWNAKGGTAIFYEGFMILYDAMERLRRAE